MPSHYDVRCAAAVGTQPAVVWPFYDLSTTLWIVDSRPRVFFSHNVLDRLVSEDAASLDGEILSVGAIGGALAALSRQRFKLESAVYVESPIEGCADSAKLQGKVKTLAALSAMKGEVVAGSLIVGDDAYTVAEGMLGSSLVQASVQDQADAGDRGAVPARDYGSDQSTAPSSGKASQDESEIDLLAQLINRADL